MPSFFRTADDVRIMFGSGPEDAEEKKQKRRLRKIFEQCVRRPGTRGNFFFHKKCASIGGKPILIMEPQGPVDRGIFQEGITRFGETLSGTFECPKTGYLILEVKKNLSTANALKYSRFIRRTVGRVAGIMNSGGDDRVEIITPKIKADRAREAAEEKRRQAEEAKEKRRLLAERRKQARAERALRAKEKKQPKKRVKKPHRQKPPVEAAPVKKPRIDKTTTKKEKARIEVAYIERLHDRADEIQARREELEAEIEDAMASSLEASADAEEARDAVDEATDALRIAEAELSQLEGGGGGDDVSAAAGRLQDALQGVPADQHLAAKQTWLQQERDRIAAEQKRLKAEEANAVALARAAAEKRLRAMRSKEEAAKLRVQEAQQKLKAAEAELEDASIAEETEVERLRTAAIIAETARTEVAIAAGSLNASAAIKDVIAGLRNLEARGLEPEDLEDEGDLRRLIRSEPLLNSAIRRLNEARRSLETAGAPMGTLTMIWMDHPEVLWAQPIIDQLA
ncbi:MAG: hypothetical protein AAFV53_08910 [Myxococcota bacterium]